MTQHRWHLAVFLPLFQGAVEKTHRSFLAFQHQSRSVQDNQCRVNYSKFWGPLFLEELYNEMEITP